nr:hypothetical protein 3 [Desulfobacteraceae bacterium]
MQENLKEAHRIIDQTVEKLTALQTLFRGSAATETADHLAALGPEDLWGLGGIIGDIAEGLGNATEKLVKLEKEE